MHRDHLVRFRILALCADFAAIGGAWLLWLWVRVLITDLPIWAVLSPDEPLLQALKVPPHAAMAPVVAATWLIGLASAGLYSRDLRRQTTDLTRVLRGVGAGMLLFLGGLFAVQETDWLSRSLVFGFALASVPVILLTHRAIERLLHTGWVGVAPWRILLVGSGAEASTVARAVAEHPQWGIEIAGHIWRDPNDPGSLLEALGSLRDLPRVVESARVDQVFVVGTDWPGDELGRLADACEEVGVRFSLDAGFLGLGISRPQLDSFGGWTVLSFSAVPEASVALVAKRVIDIAASGLALLALAPLFSVVALAIKLQDRGPVLFVQERSGLHGRPFPMLKFRTMVVDAEKRLAALQADNEMSGPVFKIKHDPRITAMGRLLRKTSIDELPQLYNVLRGDMSLVGPRPPIPAEVAKYARWQRRRLSMKPGITCIWQVSGRNNIDFETWMRLDLQYIDNWSLGLDLSLLLRTLPVVLRGTGAS